MPLSLIDSSDHIVLVAHENPDADSLGSACAFYSYLLRNHKKVTLFCNTTDINPNLAFLPWFEKLTHRFPKDADCIVSFDCGSYGRLGIESTIPLINVDHHVSNDLFGMFNLVDTDAISTTEVVYDFFVANGLKINAKMALSLYAGLLDDSKCFSIPLCKAKTFAMAHSLIDLGADHALCVDWLYRRRSLAALRIRGTLLKQMKLFLDGRLAVFEVSLSLLEETGAKVGECKSVLEDALKMRSVQAALVQIEHPRGGIKISLHTDESVNASKVMAAFGGGGHKHRAGAHLETKEKTSLIEDLISKIEKEFE